MTMASSIKFRTMGMCSNYHSLPKKDPWAENLTSLPKRRVGALLTVSAFNHKRAPTSATERSQNVPHHAQQPKHTNIPMPYQWVYQNGCLHINPAVVHTKQQSSVHLDIV